MAERCRVPVRRNGREYPCINDASWALANDVGALYACGTHLARACGMLLDDYGEPGQHIKVDRMEA